MDSHASLFRLAHFIWESQPGRYALTAVVHGTAKLSQGEEAQFTTPDELPVVYDEAQSIATRLNLVAPYKPKLDVVLVGKAYAPPRTETDRLVVRVRIGDFAKAVSVTGDRLWVRDGARWGSSPPRPFGQMALSPERAIRSAENPAGLDPAAIPVEGRLAMANLEPIAGSFSAVTGAVHSQAPSRRNLLDAPAVYWITALESGRAPGPLPDGFNFQFFNVAPQDQQLEKISPGDAVVLENLHPHQPVFTSRLPMTMPRVVGVDGSTGSTFEVPIRCDTLWIDSDRETAWIVYRGTASLSRPDQPLSLRVETERYRRPEPTMLSTSTMLATQQGALRAPLPFAGGAPNPPGYAGAAAGYGQYAPADPSKMASESTSDLPGSYPPPPPTADMPVQGAPAKRITQEIELDAPIQAPMPVPAPSGLPFAGDTGVMRALVSSDTMSLEISDVRTMAFTIPRAPTGQFYRPAETSLADPRILVQRASPGPIPDIGPTLQPVVQANGALDHHLADDTPNVPEAPAFVAAVMPPAMMQPAMIAPADEDTPPADAGDAPATIAPPPDAPPPDAPPPDAPPLVAPQLVAPPLTLPKPELLPPIDVAPPSSAQPTSSRITVPPAAVPPPLVPPPRKTIPPGAEPIAPPSFAAPIRPPSFAPPPGDTSAPASVPKPPAKPLGLVPPPRKPALSGVTEEATSMSDAVAPVPPTPSPRVAEPPRQAAFADEPTPPAPEPESPARREPTPPPRDPTPPPRDPTPPPPPPRDPTPPPPPPAPPSVEDAARIRARLASKDAVKDEIYAAHGFDDASWAGFEKEQLQAIDAASQKGDASLLERYDDAYLATLDELRGRVDELGYAKIQFGRESGQLAQILEELSVQRNDLMRLERTWRRRLQQSTDLRDRVEDELERLRGGA